MMTRTLILALSLTAAATPAVATEASHTAVEVRINDLDLTRTIDRDRLNLRVKSAARTICGTVARGTAENARRSECIAATIARAAPQTQRAIAQAQDGTQLALLMVGTAR